MSEQSDWTGRFERRGFACALGQAAVGQGLALSAGKHQLLADLGEDGLRRAFEADWIDLDEFEGLLERFHRISVEGE